MLFYNFKLKLFPRKLKSRLSGSFMVFQVFSYSIVELLYLVKGNFKVNVQHIKHSVDEYHIAKDSLELAVSEY